MSTEKTDALVIRLANFSETSQVVTFFSRDWGKISAIAKGGRRLKGPFEAALDLLTACRIVFIRKSSSGLDILTEAQLIKRFKPNGRNLISLYGGYYVAELLAGLSEEYDPHPLLYDEATQTLERLTTETDAKLPILTFELAILREIGQLPSFDVCVACGDPFGDDDVLAYLVTQGGMICPKCGKQQYNKNPIHPATVRLLGQLAETDQTNAAGLSASPQQLREMRHVLTASICQAMDRQPKMLRYLQF